MTTATTINSNALIENIKKNPYISSDDINFLNTLIELCNDIYKVINIDSITLLTYYLDKFKRIVKKLNISDDKNLNSSDAVIFIQSDSELFSKLKNDKIYLSFIFTELNYKQIIFYKVLTQYFKCKFTFKIKGSYNSINIPDINKILYSNTIIFNTYEVIFKENKSINLSGILNNKNVRVLLSSDLTLLKSIKSQFHLSTLLFSCLIFREYDILNNFRKEIETKFIKYSKLNKRLLDILFSRYIEIGLTDNYYFNYCYDVFNLQPDDIVCFLNTTFLKYNKKVPIKTYEYTINFISNDVYKKLNFNHLYILHHKTFLIVFMRIKPNLLDYLTIEHLRLLGTKEWVILLTENPSLARRVLEVKNKDIELKTILNKVPEVAIHLIN